MRYLSIYHPDASEEGGTPAPEHMAAMGRLVEEWTAKGKLIATEPLTPREHCARVRLTDGGTFEVSAETVRAGGFAFLNAHSKEEAVELCKSFLKVAGPGTCEIRQILEFAPQPVAA
jgi:hypothetical protein